MMSRRSVRYRRYLGLLAALCILVAAAYGMGSTVTHSDARITYDGDHHATADRVHHDMDTVQDSTGDTERYTSTTQASQRVRGDGDQIQVEQSTIGDGTVHRRVEQTGDGVHASQQVRDTAPDTVRDTAERDDRHTSPKRTRKKDAQPVKKIFVIIDPAANRTTPPQQEQPRQNDTDTGPNATDGQQPPEQNRSDGQDGNDTAGVPGSGQLPPTVPQNGNGTDSGTGNPPENLTGPNGGEIENGQENGITDLTPRDGARLLGDRYQTPPAGTQEEPAVQQRRLGLLDRILLFLRQLVAGIINWFARAGPL